MKINFNLLKTNKVGETIEGLALVVTAAIKKTKTNSDYLNITLSDGNVKTTANVWNWNTPNVPQTNDVVLINGTISEYNGQRQLNISSIKKSTMSSDMFAPTGDFDIETYAGRFQTFANDIPDPFIKKLVNKLYNDFADKWLTVPGALGVHHAYLAGTLHHSVNVCNNALAIFANYADVADVSLVMAGSLLHDIGKLLTYKLNGAVIEMTPEGQLFDHLVIGNNLIIGAAQEVALDNPELAGDRWTDKVDILGHIILAHHGKLEYGSPVTPRCPEALIVNYADGIDAKMQSYRDADKAAVDMWTDRIFHLDNKPMLSSKYISTLMQTN